MRKLLTDLLQNAQGFYSANMVMRWGCFLVLFGGSLFALYAHPELTMEVLWLNALLAFGLSAARMVEAYTNRKTMNADGPLQQKGTEQAPADPILPSAEAGKIQEIAETI